MKENHTGTLEGPLYIRDLRPGDYFSLGNGFAPRLFVYRDELEYGCIHDGFYKRIPIGTGDICGRIWYRLA